MIRTKLLTDEEKLLIANPINRYECPSMAKIQFQQVYPDLDLDYSTMTYNAKKWLETGTVHRRNKAKRAKIELFLQLKNSQSSR